MKRIHFHGILGLAAAVLALVPTAASAQAIISNGTVQLGVNRDGSLNVGGGPPSSQGVRVVGLRYVATNAESTAPGCTCEGWGLGDDLTKAWGGANTANYGTSGTNIAVESFSADASSAVSVVRVAGMFRITHVYRPSPNANLYQVDVTIENISGTSRKPVYRRAIDWDIEPTPFSEMVTIRVRGADGAVPAALRYAGTNGFAPSTVFSWPGWGYVNVYDRAFGSAVSGDIIDFGPRDHGAVFDFDFPLLAPGETQSFKTFYGAAGNEADALSALTTVGAELYTLGQSRLNPGTGYGTPNSFMFGFTGVGGAPVSAALETSTSVGSDRNPAAVGAAVTFVAVVRAPQGEPAPAGSVQFRNGLTVLGTVPLTLNPSTSSSSASFKTSSLPRGTHRISAAYSGGTTGAGASLVTFRTSESPEYLQEIGLPEPVVTVTGGTFVYNGGAHAATATATGTGGEPLGPVTVTYNGSTAEPVNAGSYTVVASFAGSAAYAPGSATAMLTITPAPLQVTANDATREFGTSNPSFTASFAGFAGSDGPSALGGVLVFTTPAVLTSPVGDYPIVVSGVSSSNYAIAFSPGTLRVVDTTPPEIRSVAPSLAELWSPNHRMVGITIAVDAVDAASSFSCKVTGVASNEPENGLGDGDTPGDWQITGPFSVDLRAERSGAGDGRVYTVTVTCVDLWKNASTAATTVSVPKSQRK